MAPGQHFLMALEMDSFCILSRVRGDYYHLCPQSRDALTFDRAEELLHRKTEFGLTHFVCHANVRVNRRGLRVFDLSHYVRNEDGALGYFQELAEYQMLLECPHYVVHPGNEMSVQEIAQGIDALSNLYQIPVGVEMMYPTREGSALATLASFEALFDSGVPYAIDLSHMNIVMASLTNLSDKRLLVEFCEEAMSRSTCLEIHISDNNGHKDQHKKLLSPTWFSELLIRCEPTLTAPIFYEGTFTREEIQTHAQID